MTLDLLPFAISTAGSIAAALLLVRAAPRLALLSVVVPLMQSLAVLSRLQSPDWPLALSTQLYIYYTTPVLAALLTWYGYLRIPYKLLAETTGLACSAVATVAYAYTAVLVFGINN